MLLTRRSYNAIAAAACAGLLGYALYAQHGLGLEPCPLCIFQRVAVFVLGLFFLVAALHNPGATGARVYAALLGIATLVGAGVAGRHVYIQSLPAGSVPECGATLDFMLDVLPITDVIRRVLTGSGECGKVDWTFLGLTMPAWVLIWIVGVGVLGVVINARRSAR